MVENAEFSQNFSVGIVGLGLIGGSLAKRLAKLPECSVYAWNRHHNPYEEAENLGITCVDNVQDLAKLRPNVLILCNSLASMPSILQEIAPYVDKSRTTISDVGSVKALVRQQVAAAGLQDCYVGAHPMAGSEFTGWKASSAELLNGALWALTVDINTEFWRVSNVLRMIISLCKNRAIVLDDETHDNSAALISHMPHVVATSLANVLCDQPNRAIALQLSAGSWRDMTRVALTDPQRTRAMVSENRHNTAKLLRSVISELTFAADMLDNNSETADALEKEFFDKAQSWREYKYRQRNSFEANTQQSDDTNQNDAANSRLWKYDSRINWQKDLLDSARLGESIVEICGFNTNESSQLLLRSDASLSNV
ncbi:prephenate dehydrogenase [Gardnerella vaginalis]|uniref:Prephenate dehydrogenase n=1 Tax=Gardnerella vaginalis TaxID=2702 RepID=A0A3E1INZ2_GARVA|nr:prephenate dehydrogenase/arogenate dehydrogenase family protein [Gardnerella vaginalis]MBF9308809.1 prephenate dehydrogenase/arogenate dehydrogenase family protein [Bifidobacteriaceae bacterium NR043]MBF9353759.1 prephenate dehydrogenase/arogenate dehydrogenase family protein [Bifidobacteriaceae bacterium NR044]RFD74722.1 prephenate dehydrogenase [Gardnerella vaginalis]